MSKHLQSFVDRAKDRGAFIFKHVHTEHVIKIHANGQIEGIEDGHLYNCIENNTMPVINAAQIVINSENE